MYSKPEYLTVWSTARTILAQGGPLTFWNGLMPRMFRIIGGFENLQIACMCACVLCVRAWMQVRCAWACCARSQTPTVLPHTQTCVCARLCIEALLIQLHAVVRKCRHFDKANISTAAQHLNTHWMHIPDQITCCFLQVPPSCSSTCGTRLLGTLRSSGTRPGGRQLQQLMLQQRRQQQPQQL